MSESLVDKGIRIAARLARRECCPETLRSDLDCLFGDAANVMRQLTERVQAFTEPKPVPLLPRKNERDFLRECAAVAFGAALAHRVVDPEHAAMPDEVAEQAVRLADALVCRLERT